jgi:AcrR family transcriptional regulator
VEQNPPEPLRSNARRNRERILEEAHIALTTASDASLNSIAKKAGVGIATLYRHFPSREALVLAVYRHEVEQVVEAAPRLLKTRPPIDALREWMDRFADYGMTKAGLAGALSAAINANQGLAVDSYGPISNAISMLLEANEKAGTIRAGLNPDDVLLMMSFLWRIDPKSDWRPRAGKLLDLLMDGLRAGARVSKTTG